MYSFSIIYKESLTLKYWIFIYQWFKVAWVMMGEGQQRLKVEEKDNNQTKRHKKWFLSSCPQKVPLN